ncbi:hypothetical protein O0L34_g17653 [Tuta absoluta]|nr:hypothetical protein O0L34_g17653 [Tuta absoluta]
MPSTAKCDHVEGEGQGDPEPFNFSDEDVFNVLMKMKRGKSPGHDGLSLEHLHYAGTHICKLLAQLFSLCIKFGYLPSSLIQTVVVPVVKNKTGDLSSINNYRPISLATVVAKVFERLLQKKLTPCLEIDDAQFGFRPGLSTDTAIFSLKQIVNTYRDRKTSVYGCFLDLSRAFDTLDHNTLWSKLRRAQAPSGVVDLLAYWYKHQTNNVRWANMLSDSFGLMCGVRQGKLTSLDLFNIYVNDLIVRLSSTNVGLKIDNRYLNNLSYADDMVLLSPSIRGLRKLLEICEDYASSHGLVYNSKKQK